MRRQRDQVEEHIEPVEDKKEPDSPSRSFSESRHVHHKSEAIHSNRGFFHNVRVDNRGVSQVTNVRVKVEPAKDDDPVTGCFKAIFKCIK